MYIFRLRIVVEFFFESIIKYNNAVAVEKV